MKSFWGYLTFSLSKREEKLAATVRLVNASEQLERSVCAISEGAAHGIANQSKSSKLSR